MSDWQEMSRECLLVAKRSLEENCYRRSISSSYYAAYSAITAELLTKGVTFAHGWQNPAHDQLPELIMNNLGLPRQSRYTIRKAIFVLRQSRENADYRPRVSVDRRLALEAVVFTQRVIQLLEERHGRTG